jgi:membrane-associated phospholipid phosphatase
VNRSRPRSVTKVLAAAAGILFAGLFAVLLVNVLEGSGLIGLDPGVERFWVAHRSPGATTVLRAATSLGSNVLLVPIVAASAGVLLVGWREWRSASFLIAAIAGSVVLYQLFKGLVGRPRPPVAVHLVHASGAAFPSGHATDAAAVWAALAVVLAAGRSLRARCAIGAAAVIVALVVAFSRVYLGVHWLTDVVAGLALGWAWLSLLLLSPLARDRPS